MTDKEKRREARRKSVYNAINGEKQRIITYLCYVGIIAISVLTSALQLLFTTQNFDSGRFATNLCFNLAISILSLILALKDGELANDNRKKGVLYEIKQKFSQMVKLIIDTESFRQWNDKLFERERKDYIETELANAQVFDLEYLYISDDDLNSLLKEPRDDIKLVDKKTKEIKVIALDQITNFQKEIIEQFRKGKFSFKKIPYTFFKTQDSGNSYKKYAEEGNKNKKIKILALAYRVIMVLIFSTIFALAVVNPNEADGNQILFDTVSRLFNMLSSMFLGYSLARDEALRLRNSLEYKVDTISDYLTDVETGAFKPLNRDEIIAQKIKQIREQRKTEQVEEEKVEETKPETPPKVETETVEIELTEEELKSLKETKSAN